MEPELHQVDPALERQVREQAIDKLVEAIQVPEKSEREDAIERVKEEILSLYRSEDEAEKEETQREVADILDKLVKEEVRRLILDEHTRPDGRGLRDIRPLTSEVGVLPRTHGSGLFTRGQTQALSVCTLGALGDVQKLDGLDLEESKRFMHHYNFPPFSVGEARPIRSPGRREIGHGALGERALEPVIPSEKEFPYTIRLVSEVLEFERFHVPGEYMCFHSGAHARRCTDQSACRRHCHGFN